MLRRVPVNLTIPGTAASGNGSSRNSLATPAYVSRPELVAIQGPCMRNPNEQTLTMTSDGFYGISLGRTSC